MDNLTHALVGAALAKTGLDRTTPLATPTLILAANAPDIDVLAYVEGPYYALAFRRGVTHGIPAMLLLPFAITGVMLACDRWRRGRGAESAPARPGPLLLLSTLGLWTHPVLDWMNTYGMRWWLPFDGGWVYGDSLFIIDPWLWLLLGAAVFLSRRWGRRGLAVWAAAGLAASGLLMGAPVPAAAKALWAFSLAALVLVASRRRSPPGAWAARLLGGVALIYTAAMVGADHLARRDVHGALQTAGIGEIDALMVAPRPADPTGADVVVRTPEGYLRGTYEWGASPRLRLDPGAATPHRSGAEEMDDAEVGAAIAAAVAQADARHYLAWSRFPYYRVARSPSGWRVRIADARYDGRGGGSLGGVDIDVSRAALGGLPPSS